MSDGVKIPKKLPLDVYRFPTTGRDPVIYLYLCDQQSDVARPVTGLSAQSESRAGYLSPEDVQPKPLTFKNRSSETGKCGFWEVDRERMPGVYGLQVPSFLREQGYTYIHLHFRGARTHYLLIHGIDYDPYDAFSLGLSTWARSNCHENLTSGLRKSLPAIMHPLLEDWFRSERNQAAISKKESRITDNE